MNNRYTADLVKNAPAHTSYFAGQTDKEYTDPVYTDRFPINRMAGDILRGLKRELSYWAPDYEAQGFRLEVVRATAYTSSQHNLKFYVHGLVIRLVLAREMPHEQDFYIDRRALVELRPGANGWAIITDATKRARNIEGGKGVHLDRLFNGLPHIMDTMSKGADKNARHIISQFAGGQRIADDIPYMEPRDYSTTRSTIYGRDLYVMRGRKPGQLKIKGELNERTVAAMAAVAHEHAAQLAAARFLVAAGGHDVDAIEQASHERAQEETRAVVGQLWDEIVGGNNGR